MIPAGVVTSHTIFVLKEPLDETRQWFLCGVFNSYVANFHVRLRGGTHVPASVIQQLPVPVVVGGVRRRAAPSPTPRAWRRLTTPSGRALQARVALLYGLTLEEFEHVLAGFPIEPEAERAPRPGRLPRDGGVSYSPRDGMANYGFAIDLRKCIGCHACTIACKAEHEIPVGVNRCWVKTVEKGLFPETRRFFFPVLCNQCTDAPCARICPTNALFKRRDGIVDLHGDSCIGCRACMEACPYDQLFIDPNTHTAEKCNFCANRVENKLLPACVSVCPTECRIFGDLDDPYERSRAHRPARSVHGEEAREGDRPEDFLPRR